VFLLMDDQEFVDRGGSSSANYLTASYGGPSYHPMASSPTLPGLEPFLGMPILLRVSRKLSRRLGGADETNDRGGTQV
jgi:hypothetical protein